MWGLSCIMIAHAVYIGVMASFACSAEPCLVSAVAIADHIARGTAHPGGAWNRGCTVATLPEVPLPNERLGAELTEAETLR